jgi:predicted amidohydrolase YtcJ
VNLGYDIASQLPYLRSQAAGRFTETFKVYTVTKSEPDADGVVVETEVTVYPAVTGRWKSATMNVSEREQGSQVPAVQDTHIHVAVGATPLVGVNTLWRVTASTADPSLVGREARTKGLPQAGQVTAHRYPVEEAN